MNANQNVTYQMSRGGSTSNEYRIPHKFSKLVTCHWITALNNTHTVTWQYRQLQVPLSYIISIIRQSVNTKKIILAFLKQTK